ncbi:MAG: tRNA (N6-isopentenyl adenosine(37)-C2)-methylthiotransferase MiaB [Actinomycetota bacterium]
MTQQYFIRTYGCQMNEHDTERIAGLLQDDGMTEAASLEDADVVVLNTCCIRENADNKLYGQLGHLKQLKVDKPDLQIAVAGCLAQKDQELIRERAGHVDVVFGTHNVHRAAELLDIARTEGPIVEVLEAAARDDAEAFPSALPARRESEHAAWVTIQIGCDNNCAFCIVPAVRGPEVSRPFDALVDEVAELAREGITEITLLGQNVNSYGRDLAIAARRAGEDVRLRPMFADLLRAVGEIRGIRRVRYTSPHPKDMGLDVAEAMAETDAVCEHLHLPLQSGSDRVLSLMHRGYNAERYLRVLNEARSTIPDLAVTTDIIVGFPGETDTDFERTLEVAAEAEYDSAYTFVFSPRPGTEAADMEADFVDPEEVKERYERLRVVIERSARAKHAARIGGVEDVVVEGPSKRDPAITTGRTRQNKLVHFASPEPIRPGSYATVAVTEASMQYLIGDLVEVTASPRRRTRIPVVSA